MQLDKQWAMPSANTFTIKPIKELILRYNIPLEEKIVIDPFANVSSFGTITNDLNPEMPTDYHLDALEFLKIQPDCFADMVLFDPPYSARQASECYKSFGKEKLTATVTNCAYWAACKNEITRILKIGGIIISCGWNTNGCGKGRGFECLEILIVSHGGSKNDTLVTVERKIKEILCS